MANISGLLHIGRTALLTQQKAIDITGNNIANVNTPGYSRQRLNLIQNSPVRVNDVTMSMGVKAEQGIQRFYDQFVAAQLNAENENLGRWEAQKDTLEKIELLFDEVSGYGLNAAMTDYWNAWQDLSNNPSGHVERTSLISAGQYLAGTFNQLRQSMAQLSEDIDDSVDNAVAQINEIANQIADLNLKITQVEVIGHNANDYRDQRDQLAFELAQLIDIDSFEDETGALTVMVGSGRPLVEKAHAWSLSTTDTGGVQNVLWHDSSGGTTDITNNITGGELKGLIYTRDTVLVDYVNRLDTLAGTIISEVNTLHAAGLTLDAGTPTGVDFFTGTAALDMAVNSSIEANTDLIAAASAGEGLPGGNGNAIAIANLQSSLAMPGSATFDDYYNALVGDMGSAVASANFNYDHQTSMVQQLENRRQEVSGVSLDEEMVNLIQFQHAYNAAAKLITTTEELLDTLMSIS